MAWAEISISDRHIDPGPKFYKVKRSKITNRMTETIERTPSFHLLFHFAFEPEQNLLHIKLLLETILIAIKSTVTEIYTYSGCLLSS